MSQNRFIDLEQLDPEINGDRLLELIVEQHLLTSSEVMAEIGISKQRLFSLKKQGYLREIKKGIFARTEVEKMRVKQIEEDRLSKYTGKSYDLTPAYRIIDAQTLIINSLRFFDCLKMVKYESTNKLYNKHLSGALDIAVKTLNGNGTVYMLKHEGFDYVESLEELDSVGYIRGFSKSEFIQFMESVEAKILGLPKVKGYSDFVTSLKKE